MGVKNDLETLQAEAKEQLIAELALHAPRAMVGGCACGSTSAFGPMHIADVVTEHFELLVKPMEGYISVWEIAHKSTSDIVKEHDAWLKANPDKASTQYKPPPRG